MRKSSNRWLWPAVGVIVIIALVLGFLPEPLAVDTATATRGALRVTVDEDGFTRVKERYVIVAPTSGALHRIDLDPGDPLIADQTILATVDPLEPALLDSRSEAVARARIRTSEAAVGLARATHSEIERRVGHARTRLGRIQDLFAKEMRSQDELDRAKLELDTASEQLRAAESSIRVAEFQLATDRAALTRATKIDYRDADERRLTLIAPIEGRVLRVLRESEGPVQAGEPLLEIADTGTLEVVADYLSTDAVKIEKGASVSMQGWGGDRELRGQVRLVEPSGFTKISALGVEEQRVNVVVDFSDPPADRQLLGDGFRVELQVTIYERSDAIRTPTGSLFPHGDGWAVFVVEGGTARLRPVQIGQRNGLQAEVLGGLAVDEVVIVHPSDAIEDGEAVVARE